MSDKKGKNSDSKEIYDVIRETEKLDKELEEYIGHPVERIFPTEYNQQHSENEKPEKITKEERIDASAQVYVSEDEMTAFLDLYPPYGGGNFLHPALIEEKLSENGIVHGINWDKIKEEMFTCNTEHEQRTKIAAAQGTNPEEKIPEHIQLKKRFYYSKPNIDNDSLKIDYKEISPFIIVKKNEKLGKMVKENPGKPGKTVRNNEIKPPTRDIQVLEAGKNIKMQQELIKANVSGRFIFKDSTFWIEEVLEVDGDVDYHTGHIKFPGDVVISGTIKEGFQVMAGGSVYCKKTIDASELYCKHDLIIASGVIGRKKGLIRVGGNIQAKFFENCTVESKGTQYIKNSIVNCRVFTLKELEMGERGQIIGGAVHAGTRINAHQIGNTANIPTHVFCGADFISERKMKNVKKKYQDLTLKIQRIQKLLKFYPENDRLKKMEEKANNTLLELSTAMGDLLGTVDIHEEAKITVNGKIYPGTIVEICHVDLTINEPLEKVVFRLDKKKGAVVVENIS